MTTNITKQEFDVLSVFIHNCMECNGASTPEEMKSDNMTWTRPSDVVKALALRPQVVGGLFTSLSTKSLIQDSGERMVDGRSRRTKVDSDWFLTDKGIDVYFATPRILNVPSSNDKFSW